MDLLNDLRVDCCTRCLSSDPDELTVYVLAANVLPLLVPSCFSSSLFIYLFMIAVVVVGTIKT